MSKENKLIPELRFPEFKNEGEWTETILGSVVEMKGRIGYRGYTTEDIVDKGKGAITLSPSNFKENGQLNFDKCTYISWAKYDESPEIQLEEGQTVLVKTASVGKTAYVDKLPEKATVNPQIVVLKPKNIHNRFLSFTVSHQNSQTQIRNNVGAGAIPNISQEIISKIKILIPPDRERKEQQRITLCLSSLDEVITAHSQKLNLLKDHKKGMMQNLFPQEGEKVPKYRFKEFEKDGEWVEKTLGEVAKFVNEKTSLENLSINNYISTENLLPEYAGVVSASKLPASGNFTKYKEEDILISNIRPYLKKVWYSDKQGGCSNDVFVVRAKSEINKVFLSFLLKNDDFINYVMIGAKGVKMPRGDKDLISKHPISFPNNKPEQQKIASCLSSLEALITAQTERIEQLKLHKKGLMQGLFPKIEI